MRRLFMLASGVVFMSALVSNLSSLYSGAQAPVAASPIEETDTLAAQARGYEIVLQREPNNVVALEGLAETRLEMNDPQGAIAPLEQLVSLDPDNADYAARLTEARQQAGTVTAP